MPGTAQAAPGDAVARGVVLDLDADLAGLALVTADAVVGEAVAPPGGGTDTDTVADIGAALTGAVGVTATGAVSELEATRGATLSEASATVTGATVNVLGVPVLATTGDVVAEVSCPQVGALTADTTLAGLTVLGTAVTLTANTPAVTASAAVTVPGLLTGATLTAAVTRVEDVTEPDAVAVTIQATLTLTGAVLGVPTTIPVGTVTIASASCERPAAAAVPTATAIDPDTGPTTGGQTVTITGTGFVPGDTTVTFDGVPATGVVVAPGGTSLTAVTPPNAAGPADVVVTTPGGATAPLDYTYVVAAAPTATGIDPDSGPTTGGQTVTITGTGFIPGATEVTFDGVAATGVVVADDGTSLTAVTPPNAAGPADVVVTTPAGSAAPLDYTYVAPAAPDLTGLSPTSGPTTGGTTVTITGTGLAGTTEVTFDGVPATIVSVTPTSVVVRTPAHAAGAVDVAVTTPAGTDTLPDAFTYVAAAAAPDLTGLSPTSGPTTGGTTVTITGTGLAGTTEVTFDGVPATIVSVTPTSVVVRTPAHAAGAVDVAVTTPSGTDTLPDAFTYVAPGDGGGGGGDDDGDAPTVASLTPNRGPTSGGQTVVITGSGFVDGATSVTFDGVPAASVAVVDGDTLIVRTPPGTAGPADVVVTVDGVAAEPLTYTYVAGATVPAAPGADALEPDTGPTGGGTPVTVRGRGFVPGQTSVIVCDTTLLPADVDVADDGTSLTFVTPECAAGPTDVVVVTPGGVTGALAFTYADGTGVGGAGGDDSGVGGVGGDGDDDGSLPDTGADVRRTGLLGVVLLLVGAALARRARREPVALD